VPGVEPRAQCGGGRRFGQSRHRLPSPRVERRRDRRTVGHAQDRRDLPGAMRSAAPESSATTCWRRAVACLTRRRHQRCGLSSTVRTGIVTSRRADSVSALDSSPAAFAADPRRLSVVRAIHLTPTEARSDEERTEDACALLVTAPRRQRDRPGGTLSDRVSHREKLFTFCVWDRRAPVRHFKTRRLSELRRQDRNALLSNVIPECHRSATLRMLIDFV
jgi:hypothetical protein